jgi:hypothetical protein
MGQEAPTSEMPSNVSVSRYDDEFVYQSSELPAWHRISDLERRNAYASCLTMQNRAYMPLTLLPYVAPPNALEEVRRRVARLDRASVITRYQAAYFGGKRLIAGIMAAELIERGIPPCFWHELLALDDATLEQRADLVLADLAWVRRWHPSHAKAVRYQRGKTLLTGSETDFRRETEFAFYQGKRPAWKLVGSMSMTERQQWDAAYLRSSPIKREATATATWSSRVYQALLDDLRKVRKTATFNEDGALASLDRRYALWQCSRMVKDRSPTEIALRYHQITGASITRQAVAKQLKKIRLVLRAKGLDFMV